MKKLWTIIGRLGYILAWPGLYLILNNTNRTRVLVFSGGKILVTKDWLGDGTWSLPGGGIHSKEQPVVSAQRELLEETGIKVELNQLKALGQLKIKKNGIKSNMHVFSLDLPEQLPVRKRKSEILDCQWLTPAELMSSRVSSTTITILKQYRPNTLS